MIKKLLEELDNTDVLSEGKYFYNGVAVPRVTEVLSLMLHEEYLMQWANVLGLYKRKKYTDERDRAASIGSYAHDQIERYIKTQTINIKDIDSKDNDLIKCVSNALDSFILWYNDAIKNNNVQIIGQEQTLSCPWFGGTYDMLMKINDKIYLVDFKTSNHISYKYLLQLAEYRYMIFTNLGINIDGCIILQLDKKYVSYEEYVLDFSITEHYNFIEQCLTTFLSLIYAYFNRITTENMYKNIFGGN